MPRASPPRSTSPPPGPGLSPSQSDEKKVASVQHAELHVPKDELVVMAEVDDHVVSALTAMGCQLGKGREEGRDVNGVAACRAGHKIRDGRCSRPAFDPDEIIAAAEEEIAGKGAAFAENERIRAAAQLHVAHDAAVTDDRLVTVAPANGDVHNVVDLGAGPSSNVAVTFDAL